MSSWEYVFLNELLSESKIIDDNPDPNRKIRVRLNCNGVEKRPLMSEKKGATKNYIRKSGQFIYGKQNFHKGAFGVIPIELDGFSSSGDLPAFDVDSRCLPEWINYWFKTDNRYLNLAKHAKGVGSQRVNVKSFLQEKIALPSLKQQSQIIDKINKRKLTAESFKTEQTTQATLLSQLRQAILQEAIEGKLTADWRKENPIRKGDPDFDAEALLEKIQAGKEKLIEEGKIKKQKPLAPIKAEEVPFELPEGWVWTRLGEICSKITDGFHNTPPKKTTGVPYIAATHVNEDFIDWANCHYVDEIYHRELYYKAFPQIGELLVVNIGAGCGIAAIIDVDYEFSFKNTAILKFNQDYILNKYLLFYFILNRPDIYSDLTKGGLQPFLSLSILNHILIPLPPFTEQQAIVERVEKLLSMVDELEKQVSERKEQSEQLMQAVLREAF